MNMIYFSRLCLMVCFLLSTASCTHLKYAEVPEYKITKSGPFITSESPELWKFYERSFASPKVKTVIFLVSNSDSVEHILFLERARISVNREVKDIECRDGVFKAGKLTLRPGQVFKVQCDLDVVPNEINKLEFKDSIARVEVPSDTKELLVIERVFRIEEFR